MGWTDERIEELKALWADGLSASQIAKVLGDVTRNAVIGKVHRLGIVRRAAPSPRARRTLPHVVAKPMRPPPVEEPEPVEIGYNDGAKFTTMTIRDGLCRWPIGDPQDPDFHFCGQKTDGCTVVYCPTHERKAFNHKGPSREASARGRHEQASASVLHRLKTT